MFWLVGADASAADPPGSESPSSESPDNPARGSESPAPSVPVAAAPVTGQPPQSERLDGPRRAPEPRASPPWPQLASLVPGALIHGSGTWLQGRTQTTERLLLLEASALLAIVAGGLVIYETGAAREYAGAATLLVGAGVGGFGASFLASVYASAAPADGWG